MSTREMVGVIIILISAISPIILSVWHTFYWFIKCWKKGGDWKYYANELLAIIWIIAIIVALALIFI